jgi:hypothetical protein
MGVRQSPAGDLYVAGILANAIRAVSLDGKVETIAQDGDKDGSEGRLDGPSEVVVRGDDLVAANSDRFLPGSVNTRPDKPYTLAVLPYSIAASDANKDGDDLGTGSERGR